MAVITVSREAGSGGDEIARRVCELLDYRYFDKALLSQVAQEQGLSDDEVVDFSEESYRARGFVDALLRRQALVAEAPAAAGASGVEGAGASDVGDEGEMEGPLAAYRKPASAVFHAPPSGEARAPRTVDAEVAVALGATAIRALRTHGHVVVVGRGSQAILRDVPGVLHVRIVARLEDRVRRVMETEGLSHESAHKVVGERERTRAQYLRRFHGVDWADPTLYHLTLNASLLGQEGAAELIATAARQLEAQPGGQETVPAK